MSSVAKILVVDDEEEILENVSRILTSEGYACSTLQDSTRFREVRAEVQPDVLISDLRMPGADGMTLLAAARADDPALPVILITGFATISSAVEAIQEGAFDYLSKPFSMDQLLVAVERAARHRFLLQENRELREEVERGVGFSRVIGSSASFTRILDQVRRVAPTDANVLLTGESGTGKEVVARLLHDTSRRAKKPFIPVDCAALPDGLLESELFGHEKGAFTGAVTRRKGLVEDAGGGTLFLDEIGEMSMPMQAKLLRSLEQRQVRPVGGGRLIDVDVRLIAATNVDLQAAVRGGSFREDLYYRLNVVHLELPALRHRKDDLPLLSGHFLSEASASSAKPSPTIARDAWAALERYRWPGNIRQLRNVMHRAVALDDDGEVRLSDLPEEIVAGSGGLGLSGTAAETGSIGPAALPGDLPLDYQVAKDLAMQWFMNAYIHRLLDAHQGNVTRAAEAAGVSRRTLHRWMAEYRDEAALEDEA
jgi:DNA-binding NtrC family response regulator